MAILSSKRRSHGILWYLWMTLLMFLYIYEFNLKPFGFSTFLTSRRVVVAIIILITLFNCNITRKCSKIRFPGSIYKYIKILIGFLLYGWFLSLTLGQGTGEHITLAIIRLIIFGIIPIFCLSYLVDNVDELMRIILYATIVQSVIVVWCLIFPETSTLLDYYFFDEEQAAYIERHRGQYAGGLACITAPGCLRFSMGLISCLYFCLKKQSIIYMILFFYLGFIATMIARTGMIISAVGIVIILIYTKRYNKKLALSLLFYVLISAIGLVVFLQNVDITEYFNFSRLQELIYGKGGSEFVNGYFYGDTTSIPKLFDNFIFGTGIISGSTTDGFDVIVDGGYLSVYSALGFVFAVLFYLALFNLLFSLMKSCRQQILRTILIYFIIIILLAEFKENTVLKQYMLCLYCTIAVLDVKKKYLPN